MRSRWRILAAGLALAAATTLAALTPATQAAPGITIAIDPGHGGSDSGAVANGLREKDLTLAVSLALKEELESYDGVRVVMTRTTDTRPSNNTSADLSARVNMAADAGADALVSIHFNSGSAAARGAEVWYPNASSYNYSTHTQGRALANNIQDELVDLGLTDRGIKTRDNSYYNYPDGSVGDYYAISRQARLEGIPGIIVEHAFLTSASDAARLKDPAFVRSLGIADATGIARTYGLSKGTWEQYGDTWRFMRASGPATGWFSTGGKWYWAESDGRTVRGWRIVNWRWYYFNQGTDMATGWVRDDGKWYYMRDGGDLATGWITLAGKSYYLNGGGVMQVGWLKDGDNWHYLNASGAAQVGWFKEGATWYYFNSTTAMTTGWQRVDGKWYYMQPNGAMATGWIQDKGTWYYLKADGAMSVGWEQIGGTWYYMLPSGAMATGWQAIGGSWYWFTTSGAMVTGTVTIEGRPSHFAASGAWLGYADTASPQDQGVRTGLATNTSGQHLIMAAPSASRESVINSMLCAWEGTGRSYPSQLAAGGAPTIRDFAGIVYDEAVAEGVSPELVFVQAMKETGWLGFGGDVQISQYNFSGIGAVGGGARGASFPDARTGIRAQVQHLRAYADSAVTTSHLAHPVVDPRFTYVRKGAAPVVEHLGIQENPARTGWAAAKNYGYDLAAMMESYF